MSTSTEQRVRPLAPRVRPRVLAGTDVSYLVDDTAVGRLLFAVRADGAVLATRFAPDDATVHAVLTRLTARVSPRVLRSPAPTGLVRRQLEEYLAGRRREFDLRLDLALATNFQRAVLTALPAMAGPGSVTTYGALAAVTGHPRAARAVGAALGANPLCVVLPCHRVVAADGTLTGYAGGLAVKQRLLELEGALPRRR